MIAQNFDSIQNTAGLNNLPATPGDIISIVLNYVYAAAGIILLLMFLTSGYQMIFSKGDPKAMQIAQSKITSSLVGIVILFASFWIVRILLDFFGISFNIDIFLINK